MEYTTDVKIDFGSAGHYEVEVEVDVCDEWMEQIVTQEYDEDWAVEHADNCGVNERITNEYIENLDEKERLELFSKWLLEE